MMARQSPDPEFILRGSDGPVTSVCFMQEPGSKLQLLSGTQNGTMTTWDLLLRRTVCSLSGHPGQSVLHLQQCRTSDALPARSLAFCGAGLVKLEEKPMLAIPSSSQSVVDVVCIKTKKALFSLAAQSDYGMCMDMEFAEIDEKPYLLIAYENGKIALWDLETQVLRSELQVHSNSVMSFDYSSALNRGISGSVDEKLCVWSVSPQATLTRVRDFAVTNPGVNCIKFRPDSKILATGGWDGQVRIFSGKKQTPLAVLACHRASILCVAFASDNTLAVGSKDATISIWNVYR